MKETINTYVEYCTGCGLCKSYLGVRFEEDSKGFPVPNLNADHTDFCRQVCMAGTRGAKVITENDIFGKYQCAYAAWSNDEYIRTYASSGGCITSICLYLLEKEIVDGIIQTKSSKEVPYKTTTVVSNTREEVLDCMGSRYSISQPLVDIFDYENDDKVYAFVGKPCDVMTLRKFKECHPGRLENIKYLISFFCAGMPSVQAQLKLLKALDCPPEDCETLKYRGDGWPGSATATRKDGNQKSISYSASWGGILGRDVRKVCRFCIDGVGEYADIACGDLWNLDANNKPSFNEADGRNILYGRTDIGRSIIQDAVHEGIISIENVDTTTMKYVQPYQYLRKTTMKYKILAMKIMRKSSPEYGKKYINGLSRYSNIIDNAKQFYGIIKRIKEGKIQ